MEIPGLFALEWHLVNHFSKTCFSKENLCDFSDLKYRNCYPIFHMCACTYIWSVFMCLCMDVFKWACNWTFMSVVYVQVRTSGPPSGVFLDSFLLFFWDRVSHWIRSFSICLDWSLSSKVLPWYWGYWPTPTIFNLHESTKVWTQIFIVHEGTWYLLHSFLTYVDFCHFLVRSAPPFGALLCLILYAEMEINHTHISLGHDLQEAIFSFPSELSVWLELVFHQPC